MSLQPQPIGPVPEETVRVARAAFPKGNLYLTLRDEIGTLYSENYSLLKQFFKANNNTLMPVSLL